MTTLNELIGEKGQMILAGASGGLMRWITLKEKLTDGLVSVIGGMVCAAYLGPVAIPLLEPALRLVVIEQEARIGVGCFLVGLGGVVVTGFLIDLWRLRALLGTKGTPQ